jgi:hypothetical protein
MTTKPKSELVREWLGLQGPPPRAGSALVVPARLPTKKRGRLARLAACKWSPKCKW